MKLFDVFHFVILVSLTTTTTRSIPIYSKEGCKDMCGKVRIPYPFGIGAKCSINKWYTIDCKSSTPYLTTLDNLEVLGVSLRNQTVTVNTPRVSNCQDRVRNRSQIFSVDLGRSPFLFSKYNNKFVVEGCGNAVILDHDSVVAGCSTTCRNETVININNCFGIDCCQTTIPHCLKSYNINLTGLERLGRDGACGSAFLVDENSYVAGGFSVQSMARDNSFVPVSLLWTIGLLWNIGQRDINKMGDIWPSVCRESTLDIGNGNSMESRECSCDSKCKGNPYLSYGCDYTEECRRCMDGGGLCEYDDNIYDDDGLITQKSNFTCNSANPKYSKTGCKDMCGKVRISYPFGIGKQCSANEWYTVDCNSSTPYLSTLNNLEVLSVNLRIQTVTINAPTIFDRQNPVRGRSRIDLGNSPFLFSKSDNKFVVKGCGNAVILDHGSVLTGCSTTCNNDTVGDINNCFAIGCCQTTIPRYLKSYNINLTCLERKSGNEACVSAFLVDEKSYVDGRFSVQSIVGNNSFVPISLLWTLANNEVSCFGEYEMPNIEKLDLGNGTSVEIGSCACERPLQGNPYLSNGCAYTEECRGCMNKEEYCHYREIYGDEYSGFYCSPYSYDDPSGDLYKRDESKTSLGVILGVSISMGVICLMAISYALYKVIKKAKVRRQRKRFFKRNGGLLLKQQEEADPSFVDKTIIFKSHELEKATDYFNENRILGRGGQGTVYKGMLADGRIVAVKKSKIVDESQLEQFINEVVVLSQVNHRNVVKLLGCCLETEVPLLVSEFISNGTLYDRIHNEIHEFPISLNMRLQIATEVAGALAYLHSSTSIPIYHRDIKTANILLDDKYRAKVSDFGTSRFVSIDQTHLTTLVKGTFGYLDPEYFQSSQFTEKSDVYSFGVVLVELLTGERPISLTRFGENRSLAVHFLLAMEEGRVMSIFDSMIIKEGTRDELLALANLAMQCLNMNGKNRPTMKEVAAELETIRMSHVPSMVQPNFGHTMYGEEITMLTYGESTSTFASFNGDTNQ